MHVDLSQPIKCLSDGVCRSPRDPPHPSPTAGHPSRSAAAASASAASAAAQDEHDGDSFNIEKVFIHSRTSC